MFLPKDNKKISSYADPKVRTTDKQISRSLIGFKTGSYRDNDSRAGVMCIVNIEVPEPVLSYFNNFDYIWASFWIYFEASGSCEITNMCARFCIRVLLVTPYERYDASTQRQLVRFLTTCQQSTKAPQIAKFMGPTWGPPRSCRPQMGPMLAPWTLLSGSV